MKIPEGWQRVDRPWQEYPIGTKARQSWEGGHWIKTEQGWKWHNGATFPRPGAADQVMLAASPTPSALDIERIANTDSVSEALGNFTESQTGESALAVVRAVLAAPTPPAQEVSKLREVSGPEEVGRLAAESGKRTRALLSPAQEDEPVAWPRQCEDLCVAAERMLDSINDLWASENPDEVDFQVMPEDVARERHSERFQGLRSAIHELRKRTERPLYTRPDNDGLRKAAAELRDFVKKDVRWNHERDRLLANLDTALNK